MTDITVHRHGARWAVKERGAESPIKEFPTREAAELVARDMAAGGTVEVVDEDPTGLGDVPVEETPPSDHKISAGDPAERSREPQVGL
jgi:hypothetical protein